jgi:hypothetical protein
MDVGGPAALDAEAKSIATETGERHKVDSAGKGSVSISSRKEKEYLGAGAAANDMAEAKASSPRHHQTRGSLGGGVLRMGHGETAREVIPHRSGERKARVVTADTF